jgi:DtxR family Mn-dependent transcriptional regulator
MDGLSETLENYLEAMYTIILDKNGVRVKDIAKQLEVKNSSVVSALRSLSQSGYINYEPYGIISLTPKGNDAARRLREKHRVLRHFFEKILGIDRQRADDCACKMEHIMDGEVFSRFTQFIKYIYTIQKNDPDWLDSFKDFYTKDSPDLECDSCLDDYLEGLGGYSAG